MDNIGQTPLMKAIETGNRKIVNLLLANKADIHVVADNGWNALVYALQKADAETIKSLVAKGADLLYPAKLLTDGNSFPDWLKSWLVHTFTYLGEGIAALKEQNINPKIFSAFLSHHKEEPVTVRLATYFILINPDPDIIGEFGAVLKSKLREMNIRQSHLKINNIAPDEENALEALLDTLGACGMLKEAVQNLILEIPNEIREPIKAAQQNLQAEMEEYNTLAQDSNSLYRLLFLKEQIEKKWSSIKAQEFAAQDRLSAAGLLLQVLCNGQDYSGRIRQGAISGLRHYLRCPALNNQPELWNKLNDSVQEALAEEQLKTRQVRLLPNSSLPMAIYELRTALEWMTWEVELDRHQTRMSKFNALPTIISEIQNECPEALQFFERYPLRLMDLQTYQGSIANFASSGYTIVFWTRFTPPVNMGPVHSRFLEVDDRSIPNSMGICYQLFQHPVTAVPTHYHEYLHYFDLVNQRTGKDQTSEAEIWLKELIYQMALIARYAPIANDGLTTYENHLKLLFNSCGLTQNLYLFKIFNTSQFFDCLNETILKLYGEEWDEQRVKAFVIQRLNETDKIIQIQNQILTWHPEIRYPSLQENPELQQAVAAIIRRKALQPKLISHSQYEKVLQEPKIKSWLQEWQQYNNRPEAGNNLYN